MGLTTAMYCGLSGLNANQTRVETIGHNIANVNTTASKRRARSSRRSLRRRSPWALRQATRAGHQPHAARARDHGGTTQRMFSEGAVETTGLPADMAIEGNGYFIVRTAAGSTYYTRDGSFSLNSKNDLVSMDGNYVQGFGGGPGFQRCAWPAPEPPGADWPDVHCPRNAERDHGRRSQRGRHDCNTGRAKAPRKCMVTGGGATADAGTALTDVLLPRPRNGSVRHRRRDHAVRRDQG